MGVPGIVKGDAALCCSPTKMKGNMNYVLVTDVLTNHSIEATA
jgi:hypothetical protein